MLVKLVTNRFNRIGVDIILLPHQETRQIMALLNNEIFENCCQPNNNLSGWKDGGLYGLKASSSDTQAPYFFFFKCDTENMHSGDKISHDYTEINSWRWTNAEKSWGYDHTSASNGFYLFLFKFFFF